MNLCTQPAELVIPPALLHLDEANLSDIPSEHLPGVMAQFTQLTSLNLSGSKISDTQLAQWIADGLLDKLSSLDLSHCNGLTTDILHSLMLLPNLTRLALPDLPKGKQSLDLLPSFDNPFKIHLFYTSSKATQKLAAKLYTGPSIWAVLFQIPLARRKVEEIFSDWMITLDPKSVAYWLHAGDYKHLAPQASVRVVIADNNAQLTDDNLVEFMQKFPGTQTLSLYGCPNITNIGIGKLMTSKVCPKLRRLDLTACRGITEDLFYQGKELEKLVKLVVTGTGITGAVAQVLQESGWKGKLEYIETELTITDDQLTDDDALEKLLKGKDLHKLQRITLKNCLHLTNQMLAKLLDRLNTDETIETKGDKKRNPQRLNLAVLDLSGCSEVNEEAFDSKIDADGKIEPRYLGRLATIVTGGTKIGKVLQNVYPKVSFQADDTPVTIQVAPKEQLRMCVQYHEADFPELQLPLAKELVVNRIAVELFDIPVADDDDAAVLQAVKAEPIDPTDNQFSDFTLSFRTHDSSTFVAYPAHRDVLYGQGTKFMADFRPGGELHQQSGAGYTNVHATPKASQAFFDLLYGTLKVADLDWQTAADTAELAIIFKLPSLQVEPLLEKFRSSFAAFVIQDIQLYNEKKPGDETEFESTKNMLQIALALNDQKGLVEFDGVLVQYCDGILQELGKIDDSNRRKIQPFLNIAVMAKLPQLQKRTEVIKALLDKAQIMRALHGGGKKK